MEKERERGERESKSRSRMIERANIVTPKGKKKSIKVENLKKLNLCSL
jgi:hypothetical protein